MLLNVVGEPKFSQIHLNFLNYYFYKASLRNITQAILHFHLMHLQNILCKFLLTFIYYRIYLFLHITGKNAVRKLNSFSISRYDNPVSYVGGRITGLRNKSSKCFAVGINDD